MAALETCSFLIGLTRLWLLDSGGSLARRGARRLIAAHVANHRRGGKHGNTRKL
jgi:hypothetical protein